MHYAHGFPDSSDVAEKSKDVDIVSENAPVYLSRSRVADTENMSKLECLDRYFRSQRNQSLINPFDIQPISDVTGICPLVSLFYYVCYSGQIHRLHPMLLVLSVFSTYRINVIYV